MKNHQPVVDPEDRVPFWQKIAYGAGCMPGTLSGWVSTNMFNPVFNIAMGISPAVIGTILMVYRLWDSMTDVVMGNISDNTRTVWGRRRPYIMIGSILTGFMLPILWHASPDWSQTTLIAYIVVTGLILYTATTIWGMPYYSLGMELTPDYNERTRVTAFRAVFEKLAGLVGGWMLALVSLPLFGDPVTGEPDMANGMKQVSILLGILIIAFGVLPAIFVKERYYLKDASKQGKVGLLTSIKLTLRCRPFILLMAVYLLQVVGTTMVNALGMYLNIYFVNGGDLKTAGVIQGLKGTAMLLPGIFSVPFWAWISEKVGKRNALGITILLGFVANTLIYFCYTPAHPYLQILPSVFLSAFGSAIWMLVPSMQADIADYDELKTGERREGSFSSVSSWFFKLATTLTIGISGFILTWTGFDVVKYGSHQPPEVLAKMLAWYAFMPMVMWAIALVLLFRYKLSHAEMMKIRADLEARRGMV